MSTLRYHLVPHLIECADCHDLVERATPIAGRITPEGTEVQFRAICPGCGNAGIIVLPIYTARPLPEEPPK